MQGELGVFCREYGHLNMYQLDYKRLPIPTYDGCATVLESIAICHKNIKVMVE
jgi:hypothetical protein